MGNSGPGGAFEKLSADDVYDKLIEASYRLSLVQPIIEGERVFETAFGRKHYDELKGAALILREVKELLSDVFCDIDTGPISEAET